MDRIACPPSDERARPAGASLPSGLPASPSPSDAPWEASLQAGLSLRHPMIVAICNHKGGVAKTTTCVNLAVGLAAAGQSVTVIDMDSLGSATRSLGIDTPPAGTYDLLSGRHRIDDLRQPSAIPGVSVVGATPQLHLAEIEQEILSLSREKLLQRLTSGSRSDDTLLIDCPPTLGIVSVTAIAAADMVLIPVTPNHYALDALEKTLKVIDVCRPRDERMQQPRILITMVDPDDASAASLMEVIRQRYGDMVYPFHIPLDRANTAAAASDHALLDIAPESPTAHAYLRATLSLMREQRGLAPQASLAGAATLPHHPLRQPPQTAPEPPLVASRERERSSFPASNTQPPRSPVHRPLARATLGGLIVLLVALSSAVAGWMFLQDDRSAPGPAELAKTGSSIAEGLMAKLGPLTVVPPPPPPAEKPPTAEEPPAAAPSSLKPADGAALADADKPAAEAFLPSTPSSPALPEKAPDPIAAAQPAPSPEPDADKAPDKGADKALEVPPPFSAAPAMSLATAVPSEGNPNPASPAPPATTDAQNMPAPSTVPPIPTVRPPVSRATPPTRRRIAHDRPVRPALPMMPSQQDGTRDAPAP